jgi:GNAT superfamily N-acetyltransferase
MGKSVEPSGSDFTVRRAGPGDGGRVATVAARLFEQTYGDANDPANMRSYLAKSFSESLQSAEIADDGCALWIAEDGEQSALGYATLCLGIEVDCVSGERPAEIQRMYIDRAWYGRGLGDALMAACVGHARMWGCDVLWLGVWEENPRAIAFYKKNGFVAVGSATFALGHDIQRDLVMAKPLA